MSPCFVILEAWILRMSVRAASFGRGISILRSSLPGRMRAGSSTSGLLVAMIILTCRQGTDMHGVGVQGGLQLSPSMDATNSPTSTLDAPELPLQTQTDKGQLPPAFL